MTPLERNKSNARASYDLMFNQGRPAEAVERYVGEVYIQHNPEVGDGKQALIASFERRAREDPGKRVHFRRVIAEGDLAGRRCTDRAGRRAYFRPTVAIAAGTSSALRISATHARSWHR